VKGDDFDGPPDGMTETCSTRISQVIMTRDRVMAIWSRLTWGSGMI